MAERWDFGLGGSGVPPTPSAVKTREQQTARTPLLAQSQEAQGWKAGERVAQLQGTVADQSSPRRRKL
jgi:hypothetical protein